METVVLIRVCLGDALVELIDYDCAYTGYGERKVVNIDLGVMLHEVKSLIEG